MGASPRSLPQVPVSLLSGWNGWDRVSGVTGPLWTGEAADGARD